VRSAGVPVQGSRVLELGVGTGFYVPLWESLGTSDVVGIDITDVAVDDLARRYPRFRFHRADITDELPVEPESFDIVTAFEVLLHVTDDGAFERALANAARAARPGGYLLVVDLFLHRDEQAPVSAHNVVRSLDQYRQALAGSGWCPLARYPVFLTMAPALDLPPGRQRELALRWWQWLQGALRERPGMGRGLGAVLGAIDAVGTRLLRDGPSTELLVARRE
jgi:SAM-dependent methyltransferase